MLVAWLQPPKPPQFATAQVMRGDIEAAVLASGTLQALRQVDVGAQANGQLQSLKVGLGQAVKKGDLLAEIDPMLARSALGQAQAGLRSLLAQKAEKRIRLSQAQLTLTRQRDMRAQDAAAQQDLESAETELKATQATLESIDAQIDQQRLAVAAAETNLSYTRIVAPIDGEVVSITTLEGQTVVASFQVPTLLKLADLSTMTVKAQVSEADVVRIHVGQPAYFTILGEPDKRYYGKLRAIQPSPEKINNAIFFDALFDVPNPDHKLRIDMTAQVGIVLGEARHALTLPVVALGARAADGTYSVRVVRDDGTVQTRKIEAGVRNAVRVEVKAGLKEGERVVTGDAGRMHENDDGVGPEASR